VFRQATPLPILFPRPHGLDGVAGRVTGVVRNVGGRGGVTGGAGSGTGYSIGYVSGGGMGGERGRSGVGRRHFAPGPGAGRLDGLPWSVVARQPSLEVGQDTLGTFGRPYRHCSVVVGSRSRCRCIRHRVT